MAKTFNDFIVECVSYPYSQEHLDLMKECSELSLMEQYIENQEYLMENAHLFGENVNIEAGYFAESVDEYALDVLYEKKEEKKKGIFARIGGFFRKIIKAVKNFFFRKKKKHKDKKKKKDEAKEKLEKFTTKDVDYIVKIVERGKKVAKDFVPLKGKQPESKEILKRFKVNIPDDAKDWLVAGLSERTVVADVSKFASEEVGPLSVMNINTAMNSIASNTDLGTITGTLTNLRTTWNTEKSKGFVIDCINEESITKIIDQLQKIESMWATDIKTIKDEAETNANKAYSDAIYQYQKDNKKNIEQNIRKSEKSGNAGKQARKNLDAHDNRALSRADAAYSANGGEAATKAAELAKYLNVSVGHTMSILIGLDALEDTISNGITAAENNGGKAPVEVVSSDSDGEREASDDEDDDT